MNEAQEGDEWLDIVDEEDRLLFRMLRSDVHTFGVRRFRAVAGFIRNTATGELWLPRRAQGRSFPLHLDASVAGHVKSGETYEQALAREAREELGISIGECGCQAIGKLVPHVHGSSAFIGVYQIPMDHAPQSYNREDFISGSWWTPTGLLHAVANSCLARPDLVLAVREFFPCH